MKHVIEIEGLTKVYPNKFTAVSDLTMKVPKGVFGFLGPNGAGKTTTILILAGAMRPTSGTASILGHDVLKDSLEVKKCIGYLPEHPGYYEDMSGLRFLRYMGELSGLNRSNASKKARELLKWAGLGGWGSVLISRYSEGMKQRLGLVQALVSDPEIVFMDEPTSNLDPLGRVEIIRKVRELAAQGKSVFVSSHIIHEIEQMADHVGIINEGKLLVQGNLDELVRAQAGEKWMIWVSKPEVLKKELKTRDYIINLRLKRSRIYVETSDVERLCSDIPKIAANHHMQLHAFEPVRAGLEAVFINALKRARRIGG